MDDQQIKRLLTQIAKGNEDAFSQFFDLFYPKLIQIALAFVPGIVAAQETISDLFYKILKNPATLAKVENFDRYIFMAVKNQCYAYLSKNRNRSNFESIHQSEDYIVPDLKNPENSLLSDELFELVERVVQGLPPKRKAIYQLVKEEGKKYREVAEILDISVKTVELQMSYALKLLRKQVSEYLESKDFKKEKPNDDDSFLSVMSIFF